MSSSGGGSFDELERSVRDTARKWKNDPWEELYNAGLFTMTGGMAGSDKGKIKEGWVIHSTDEWVGELSGRNKARAAGYETEARIKEAEEMTKKQREDELLQRYRADIAASRGAQGVIDSAAARERTNAPTTAVRDQTLGDERDYLGL